MVRQGVFNMFWDFSENYSWILMVKKSNFFKGMIFLKRVQFGADANNNPQLVNLNDDCWALMEVCSPVSLFYLYPNSKC